MTKLRAVKGILNEEKTPERFLSKCVKMNLHNQNSHTKTS